MWCSPTASPQTHPRVVFFPTSASGFRSSKRTSTLFFDFIAIVAAVMQPAMPAPTTTTSLSSNDNPLERPTAALTKNQENEVDNQFNRRGQKPTLPISMAQDDAHTFPPSNLRPSSSRWSNRVSSRSCLQPWNLPSHYSWRQSHPDRYQHDQ